MIECFSLGGNSFMTVTGGHRARKTGPGSCQVRNKTVKPE